MYLLPTLYLDSLDHNQLFVLNKIIFEFNLRLILIPLENHYMVDK